MTNATPSTQRMGIARGMRGIFGRITRKNGKGTDCKDKNLRLGAAASLEVSGGASQL